MRIDWLEIAGFGVLRGTFRFHPGLNLLIAPNESGKTTLGAALTALLYGLKEQGDKRRKKSEDEDRYSPWSGDPYRLTGELALQDGRRLRVERDLNRDRLRATDPADGRDLTADYARGPNGDRLGEALTGLTRSQFVKVACLTQIGNPNADFSEFSSAVARLLTTETDGGTVPEAILRLRTAREKYSGLSSPNPITLKYEIDSLHKELTAGEAELAELCTQADSAAAAAAELARWREELAGTETAERREELLRLRAGQAEAVSRQTGRAKAAARLTELQAEAEKLAPLAGAALGATSRVAALAARLEDLNTTEAEWSARQRELSARRTRWQQALSALGEKGQNLPERRRRIETASAAFAAATRAAQHAAAELADAERRLADAELTPQMAAELTRQAESLSTAHRTFLAEFREQELARHQTQSQQQAGLTQAEAELHAWQNYARKLRLYLPIGIALYAGIFPAAVWLILHQQVAAIVIMVLGSLAGTCMVAWRHRTLQERSAARQTEILAALARWREALSQSAAAERQAVEQLAQIAGRLGITSEAALAAGKRLVAAQSEMLNWNRATAAAQERRAEAETAAAELRAALAAGGIALSPDTPLTEASIARALADLDAAAQTIRQAAEADEEGNRLQAEKARFDEERRRRTDELAELLTAGQIDPGLPPAEAARDYARAAAGQARLRVLRGELLPEAERAVGPAPAENETEVQTRLENQIGALLAEHPEWTGLQPDRSAEQHAEGVRRRQEAAKQLRARLAEAERRQAEETALRRRRRPELEDRLELCRQALRRAERFAAALDLAESELTALTRRLHESWNPVLTRELDRRLGEVYGLRWRANLTPQLGLVLTDAATDRPLDQAGLERHLSRGARDQVGLAARLVFSQVLGRNEPLPLILDDPFVNSDDARFLCGLDQLLAEAEAGRQIFLFSCHSARHAAILGDRPELAAAQVEWPQPRPSPAQGRLI